MKHWPLRVKVALWTSFLVGMVVVLAGVGVSFHLYKEGVQELDKDREDRW